MFRNQELIRELQINQHRPVSEKNLEESFNLVKRRSFYEWVENLFAVPEISLGYFYLPSTKGNGCSAVVELPS